MDFEHVKSRRSLQHRYSELEGEIKRQVDAAVKNELITRERVKMLEDVVYRPFWRRMRWLFLGRLD